ncbi:hypothetical protein M0805_008004 [Coniferiporia weirii]|nr:hypothetical protein M0805_008004 [Coniferiporia weirii]
MAVENTASRSGSERAPLLAANDRRRSYQDGARCVPAEESSCSDSDETYRESELDAASPPPFVWKPLIAILFMGVVQPACFELIFPFINQMIVENGIVDNPEDVGFYSGFIESIFQVMSCLTIIPCSFISDRLGRKPVVIMGTLGMAMSISLFGMSKSYWAMIATRCIGGMLGGTWSALKVMMAEIYTDKTHRAYAFSTFQIAFKVGQILGQPLGGLLSHPARTIAFFDTPFWRTYPFALPCFIAAAFALASTVWAYFVLEETSPKIRRTVNGKIHEDNGEPDPSAQRVSMLSVLTPHVFSVLVSIFVMTIVSETIFALYPLFAFTPISSGGLGLSEPQIGAHMATRAVLAIFVLFLYPPAASRLRVGVVSVYSAAMALWPFAVACLPVLNALARTGARGAGVGTWPFDAAVTILFVLWSLGGLVWPTSQIVVIEAAPNAESLAVVNGLAQMVQTFTMALAPAFVTNLFAYSVESQILGGNLIYAVMLAMACLGALHALTIKEAGKPVRAVV